MIVYGGGLHPKLNLSSNCLNGQLDDTLGVMSSLEILHLDNNQITAFPTNTDGWINLKTLTASENSIRGHKLTTL